MMIRVYRAAQYAFALLFLILIVDTLSVAAQQSADQSSVTQTPSAPPSQASQPAVTPPASSAPATPPQSSPAHVMPGQTAAEAQQGKSNAQANGGSKDRLFYAMPNFLTLENSAHVPPLTVGQKFRLQTKATFDPFQFGWYALVSGIGQAENSEPAYGQGWGAYGKRYATSFGDGLIEGYMVSAIVPSVFRQDPRYFQSGQGGFLRRAAYALSRLAVTRGDSGRTEFNISEVGGSLAAAAISNYSYHPAEDKTFANTTKVWGTQVGYDAIAIELKEFWPDIRRKMSKKH